MVVVSAVSTITNHGIFCRLGQVSGQKKRSLSLVWVSPPLEEKGFFPRFSDTVIAGSCPLRARGTMKVELAELCFVCSVLASFALALPATCERPLRARTPCCIRHKRHQFRSRLLWSCRPQPDFGACMVMTS